MITKIAYTTVDCHYRCMIMMFLTCLMSHVCVQRNVSAFERVQVGYLLLSHLFKFIPLFNLLHCLIYLVLKKLIVQISDVGLVMFFPLL